LLLPIFLGPCGLFNLASYITLIVVQQTPTLYYFIISSHPEMAAATINYNPPLLLFLTASKVKIISSTYASD